MDSIIDIIEKDGIQYFNMSIEEAREIIRRKNRWCRLLLKISWKARFLEKCYCSSWKILNCFGKDAHDLYIEKHPEARVPTAIGVIYSYPISRRVGWEDLAKSILKIEPLEKNNE